MTMPVALSKYNLPVSEAPNLESERLRLRAHRIEDFDASFAMWTDPEVYRAIVGEPSTRQQSWSRLLTYAGLWKLLGFGYWVIEEKQSGLFIGEIGFANFQRAIEPPIGLLPEAGWALASNAHDQGYATEALKLILSWADTHMSEASTVCLMNPANVASMRVAKKCGYEFWRDGVFKNLPVTMMNRRRALTA